jgi:hypothetical protein
MSRTSTTAQVAPAAEAAVTQAEGPRPAGTAPAGIAATSDRPLHRKCACAARGESCERCSPPARRFPPSLGDGLPPLVHDVLRMPGMALSNEIRGLMERRLDALPRSTQGRSVVTPFDGRGEADADRAAEGALRDGPTPPAPAHDFSNVRVHADGRAGESARLLGADAYSIGSHIVFAQGRFAPHSVSGLRLLAHELAHVVQVGGTGHTVQRKKGDPEPAATKFYQEVIDTIRDQEQTMAEAAKRPPYFPHQHLNYRGLKALLPLCEAVDQERREDIPKLLDAFIAADIGFHLGTISERVMNELAARMIRSGLNDESLKLRKHFAEQSRRSTLPIDLGAARRDVNFLSRLVDMALTGTNASSPEGVATAIEFMIRAFVPLRDALAAVDLEALEHERRGGGNSALTIGMSRQAYYNGLVGLVERLFAGIESGLQQLIDRAADDLSTGKGSGTLERVRDLLKPKLYDVLFPSGQDEKKDIAGLRLRITSTTIHKGHGAVADAFAQGKDAKKRSTEVSTYDPEQDYARELEMTLARLFEVRTRQVLTIARIYGAAQLIPKEQDKDGSLRADAEHNAEVLAKQPHGLRLHSDDDWRDFITQKYRSLITPSGGRKAEPPASALKKVIDLLFAYLQAFTVHVHYTNIYDAGEPSYLNRDFARTLGGQLVQDCGVYALRVVYVLSLVRNDLGLKFKFVSLPLHVAVVVQSGDGTLAFMFHNNEYLEFTPQDVKDQLDVFNKNQPPTGDATAGGATGQRAAAGGTASGKALSSDDPQFLGELAGATFISGPLEMPFVVSDVPETGKDPKRAQRDLWAFYKRIAGINVFGPATRKKGERGHLLELRYLAITESVRAMHNDLVIPMWNQKGPAAWNELIRATTAGNTRTHVANAELRELVEAHEKTIAEAWKPAEREWASIEKEEAGLSEMLREPNMVAQEAQRGWAKRAAKLWVWKWLLYRRRLRDLIDRLENDPDGETTLDDLQKELAPPFIPADEKALTPVD